MATLPPVPEVKRDRSCLDIRCPEYYQEVLEECDRRGLRSKFEQVIQERCINNFRNRYWYRCVLFSDRYPLSFGWMPQTKDYEGGEWRNIVSGGLNFCESSQGWTINT